MENTINTLDDLKNILHRDIYKKQGSIMIYVGGIPQVSQSNDIVGNCIQEWLPAWFKDNGLNLTPNPHTQEFPDFIAHFKDEDVPMDIKCWNYENSPAFDIANFNSFYKTIYENPAKLYAKYLVIGYKPNIHGFTIEYIGMKNLWEILGPSLKYPLSIQVKRGRTYAVRPINFKLKPEKSFNNLKELIYAVKATREMFISEDTNNFTTDEWLAKVLKYAEE